MPIGLQIIDQSGTVILDTTSRPLRILQVDAIEGGINTNITIPTTTTVIVPVVAQSTLANTNLNSAPIITQTSGNLNITWEPGTTGNALLLATEF